MDLAELLRALGVDEVHAREVQDDRARLALGVEQLADALLERFGGGEEEAEVQAQDDQAVERLVAGCSPASRKTCVPGWRLSTGIAGEVAT